MFPDQINERFALGELIGKGASARVYRGTHRDLERPVESRAQA